MDLERVDSCPVCGESARSLLHDKLTDNVFFTAAGEWTMWRCSACRSAYYDPRPTPATIGLAYSQYYTHEQIEPPPPATKLVARLRSVLANGYRNARFGTKLKPSSRLGHMVGRLVPPLARSVETEFRYLPHCPGPQAKLLDIGCGGGDWLAGVRQAGWLTFGADPDPVARSRGADQAIEIRENAKAWLDQAGTFDAITSNHSLEHVHDPGALLHDAFELLKPGGQFVVETPNIDGWGHRIYGRDWVGLDPPRHLVLFNRDSLRAALARTGFVRIRQRRRSPYFPQLALFSARLAAGHRFDDPSARVPTPGWFTRFRANHSWRHAEALLFTANKPV